VRLERTLAARGVCRENAYNTTGNDRYRSAARGGHLSPVTSILTALDQDPNMTDFSNILVDVDATAPAHPALERAVALARRSGGRLTITDVLSIPAHARRFLPPEVEEDLIARRREQLTRIAGALTGVPAEVKLLFGRPGTVLIQEVLRSGHDLLVRSHDRDLAVAAPRPFGAVDMELLRKCPCPVMLIRHGAAAAAPQIVAAVNASTDRESERALNTRIIALALLVGDLEGGTTRVLQAWAPFAEGRTRSLLTDDGFASYVDAVRQGASDKLRLLAQSFRGRLSEEQLVNRRGEPDVVIPEYVVSHGIDLVVMGTVARGGIAGLLIGNTAERVLAKLPCSVLAVKPEGFVSPVSLHDA